MKMVKIVVRFRNKWFGGFVVWESFLCGRVFGIVLFFFFVCIFVKLFLKFLFLLLLVCREGRIFFLGMEFKNEYKYYCFFRRCVLSERRW